MKNILTKYCDIFRSKILGKIKTCKHVWKTDNISLRHCIKCKQKQKLHYYTIGPTRYEWKDSIY